MAETFDLEHISEARARDLKNDPHLQRMSAIALLAAITLAIFLAEAVSDGSPLIELGGLVLAFVATAIVAGALLLTAREGSAIVMTVDDSGVRLTRPRGRVRRYRWSTVARSFWVMDRHSWATFGENPESSHYVLHESYFRQTALTEKAFNGLLDAARTQGLTVQARPFHPGGTVLAHRFSTAPPS